MEFDIEDASGGVRPEVGDSVDEPSDEADRCVRVRTGVNVFPAKQLVDFLGWLWLASFGFWGDLRVVKANSKPSEPCESILPRLETADQIGGPLGVTGRTVLNWAEAGKIPTALRLGKIVRFDPVAVAKALGLFN